MFVVFLPVFVHCDHKIVSFWSAEQYYDHIMQKLEKQVKPQKSTNNPMSIFGLIEENLEPSNNHWAVHYSWCVKIVQNWPTIGKTVKTPLFSNSLEFKICNLRAKLICQFRDSPLSDPSLATLLGYTTEFLGPVLCCFIFPWKVFMNLLNTGRLCMGNKIGCKSLQKKTALSQWPILTNIVP